MNCLDCRRELLVDPRSESAELTTHIKHCNTCRQEQQRLLDLDDALDKALAYPVPGGLADRIIDTTRDEADNQSASKQVRSGRIWQMAAGIMLGIGLAMYLGLHHYNPLNTAGALDTTVLNHITDEINHLYETHDISNEKLDTIMTAINTRASDGIGKLNYAGKCQIRKNVGAHLIVNGEKGPVTVLVMPGEHIDGNMDVKSERFDGMIYPTGYGSIAVVGEKDEQIPVIAERMLSSITPANS